MNSAFQWGDLNSIGGLFLETFAGILSPVTLSYSMRGGP